MSRLALLVCAVLGGCVSSWEEWRIAQGGIYECPEGRTAGDSATMEGLDFSFVCAGTFLMGSPEDEEDRDDDERQHEVTLTHSYWMGTYEVTQAEFEGVMGYQPSYNYGCAECPVEAVSWYEAAAYANALSDAAGLDRCYACTGVDADVECEPDAEFDSPYACPGYRLPTEAEWEMAARAGETFTYAGSDDPDEVAWYSDNADEPQSVGDKQANAWGLYDMSGNVWEWTGDWYDGYPSGAVEDPPGPVTGSDRVFRGGSWGNRPSNTRVANRSGVAPARRNDHVGLRLVRE